jgi:hypothetical protein
MKIKIFEPPLPDLDMVEIEPPQMNRGGDVELEAFMRNNPEIARATGNVNTSTTSAPVSTNDTSTIPYTSTAQPTTFADAYALWQQSKPEAPRRPSGGIGPTILYNRKKKQYDKDFAAWEASEPDFDTFTPPQQQEEEPTDPGPSPQDSDDFDERFRTGQLTGAEIQRLIEDGTLSEEQVQTLIGNYQLSEDQLAQLFSQGLLTEDQIREIIGQEVDEATDAEGIAASLTEEQINELVQQGLAGLDMSTYATQEDIQGLESLFQNYLTPEQLEAYLPEDSSTTIDALTKRIADLESQYANVTSQYEADAVNQQISDAKQEVQNFYAASAPTGPRTGSTSQFDSGTSFLPGGSPMASLIEGQREAQGADPFTSYLKTFTPSYSEFNEPFSPEEYNERNQPFMGGMYNNPFTGGMSYNPDKRNMGGQVSNGIMDLTNFDTNVQPFQNAFRPNVPRN